VTMSGGRSLRASLWVLGALWLSIAAALVGQQPKQTPPQKPQEVTVYVTKSGTKYHRAICRHLAKSKVPISLKDAKARGYTPCRVCKPPE
jgi:hypothetical protein